MSSLDHVVSAATLSFSLEQEMQTVREQLATAGERIGRTLLKNGALRVTLVGLKPGGSLRPHKSDGPISVQVLEGTIDFEAGEQRWPLPTGTLFSLEAGIMHGVSSTTGGIFLLTVIALPSGAPDTPPAPRDADA